MDLPGGQVGGKIGDEPFQGMDGNRFVQRAPVAFHFAGVKADPAADAGEGIFFPDHVPGPFEIALSDLEGK